MADWIDKLTELRRQRDAGGIDAAEFEARRAEIFAERDAARPLVHAPPPRPEPTPAADAPVVRSQDVAALDEISLEAPDTTAPADPDETSPVPQADTAPALEPAMTASGPEDAEMNPDPFDAEVADESGFGPPTENTAPATAKSANPAIDPGENTPSGESGPGDDEADIEPAPTVQDSELAEVASPPPPPAVVPTYTPPPQALDAEPRRGLLSNPAILIGTLAVLIGGIGLGSMLLHSPRKEEDKAPAGLSVEASQPDQALAPAVPQPSPPDATPPSPDTQAAPPPASFEPKIVSGRVATSAGLDGNFTVTLLARYANVGPNDEIVASLWRGRVKADDCVGGVPAAKPRGSYRCELNQLPPGSYEFHVGFAGRRPSVYRFKLVARIAPPPPPQQLSRVVPPPAADIITQPEWVRRPNSETVSRFYPSQAMQRGIEGSTRLSCRVNVSGRLVGCIVLSETPSGYGFGAAAIRLVSTLRMRPMLRNGEPVDGGMVTIPIQWRLQ